MIKSELVSKMAKHLSQIPEHELTEAVNQVIAIMGETLGKGGRIEIRDFGSFRVHYRAPRLARNPKTGKKVMTSAKYKPHFKPGKELRHRVNDGNK